MLYLLFYLSSFHHSLLKPGRFHLKHCCIPPLCIPPALLLGGDGARSMWLYIMKECLPGAEECFTQLHQQTRHSFYCINNFISSWAMICWLYLRLCLSLLAGLFAWRFTVNHREKPGPLPWPLFKWFHGLSSCFAALPGDKQVLFWVLFVSGMLPDPQLCIPPPWLQRYFVRKGAWSGANSNRDLPVCPLSGLTLAGVAFLQTASIWALESLETDRQSLNC